MEKDKTPQRNISVEVSVGWNSSSPKRDFQFPDSPVRGDLSARTQQLSQQLSQQQLASDDTTDNTDASKNDAYTMSGVLGKYCALIPGSSPPRSENTTRKRKPESPLQVRNATQQSIHEKEGVDSTKLLRTECPSSPSSASSSDSEFEALIKAGPPPVRFQPTYFYNRKVRRFMVQRVAFDENNNELSVFCLDSNNAQTTIRLLGSWSYSTRLRRGDVIHLYSQSHSQALVASDDNDVMVIVNPDILVSCTSVAEALSCERQVVLRNQVRFPSDLNQDLVLGSVKHEFIQICFTNNWVTDTQKMSEALRSAATAYSLDLKLVHLTVDDACSKLYPLIATLKQWAVPIWGPNSSGRTIYTHRGSKKVIVRLNKSVATEEEMRSPFLGLVGKVDVTTEVSDLTNGVHTQLAALEIKTGRSTQSIAHRAQATLYTMLMAERYPNNSQPYSLLYYTVDGTVLAVVSILSELRALFQKRNSVAYDLWEAPPTKLPIPVSASDMSCKWCSRKDSCTLYTAFENGEFHGKSILRDNYTEAEAAGKLSTKYIEFSKHWNHLLQLEYDVDHRYDRLKDRQWWIKTPHVALWTPLKQEEMTANSEGYTYLMEIKQSPSSQTQRTQLAQSVFSQDFFVPTFMDDERVVISTKQFMGISYGAVLSSLSDNKVILWSRFKLLMTGKYRIDSDPWNSETHVGLARFNLISLMENSRLRELIVDLVEPKFLTLSDRKFQNTLEWASSKVLHSPVKVAPKKRETPHFADLLSSSSEEENDEEILQPQEFKEEEGLHGNSITSNMEDHLNEDQTTALNKVLGARDYALILGMPGTGKTTTIAAIVATLVKRGKSVLISAYTNSAVDTLVLKLLSANVPTLRLAASLRDIHAEVLPVAACTQRSSSICGKDLTDFTDTPVVACTSHLTGNKLFALRNFDYCILDEASQITLPFCIGPLRLATTFVLVGDHYQLPPLVRNTEAKDLGLAESLFKILCEAHPQSVVNLTKQYRMCADIMSLASDLVYDGKLVCGSEAVANQKLILPRYTATASFPNKVAVDPENRVVFLNTDVLGDKAHELVHSQGSSNLAEAEIIRNLIDRFDQTGLNMKDVAVISVYRKQLNFLTEVLGSYLSKGLEILTADQAQGRDKKCILVSLVRSNDKTQSGELLKDWRRLNVAFTRAKQKLVIVGSKRVMECADGVARFYQYIEHRGWVHDASL